MLASLSRAFIVAAALAAVCTAPCAGAANPAPATPAKKKPPAGSSTPAPTTAKKKPAAAPVRKPAPPAPPPPPPAVELIGYVVMPPGTFRAGPPSGQYDDHGLRAPAPRFESQPVQGISSIKPGESPGAWWALSDNGYGNKWNSFDYRLCIYLFDVEPRTAAGTDSRTALQAVIELSDPAKYFPWRLAEEDTPERFLTGADADPESLVTMANDTFWIGDETGPWLLHFSVDGELLDKPVELPDNIRSPVHPLVIAGGAEARTARSRGFEALELAGDNRTLVGILEGPVNGDPPHQSRVYRFDSNTQKWLPGTLIYELDADSTSVTDLSRIDGNRFVVLERDDLAGDAAKSKRVYAIDLDKAVPGKPLAKKLVIDLLAIGNARGLAPNVAPGAFFRFPYHTPESIQVLDRRHVVVVNDNNYPSTGGRGPGVTDATEWLWLELGNSL